MFKNKTVIVTGAAQGIGLGIAQEFADNEANVVLADYNEKELLNAKEGMQISHPEVVAIKCDVSSKKDVDALIKATTDKFGGIDILINNAGIYPNKPFEEIPEDDWDKVIDINLKGVFLCSQAAAKIMKEGAKIVNISSIASFVSFNGYSHYSATKGGVNALTRGLALELSPRKINVNAIAPGAIITPGINWNEKTFKEILPLIPWNRVGKAEDIAHATLFLSSSKADYITGQVLVVDGGWTLR